MFSENIRKVFLRENIIFLILKLESFISGNKRNFIQEGIFFSDFLFFMGWGLEKLHLLYSDGRWHGEGGMLKWWHHHWVFLKCSYFAHIKLSFYHSLSKTCKLAKVNEVTRGVSQPIVLIKVVVIKAVYIVERIRPKKTKSP